PKLALAAATRMDLALDHIERAGKLARRGLGLVSRKNRHARRYRRTVGLQKLFGLMFMDVHSKSPWVGRTAPDQSQRTAQLFQSTASFPRKREPLWPCHREKRRSPLSRE